VIKVEGPEQLRAALKELFRESALLLAQEFFYTDFDWRIGILDNKPLYACRYYMVKNHWQIYHHGTARPASGEADTLPTEEVPRNVLRAALAATQPIGDGLYGVDVKEGPRGATVIEVNDNPSIDAGAEDAALGAELYLTIMRYFVRRIEGRGRP